MSLLLRVIAVVAGVLAVVYGIVWAIYSGGEPLPDRTSSPSLPPSALEVVVDLELPPGNIAVSDTGRVFFTFHPEGAPLIKVAELVDGKPMPFPTEEWQRQAPSIPYFQTPLAVRIDRQNRLWVLDHASYATGTPRILAFALDSRELVYEYEFPNEVAGLGSMLNDFQVSPSGERIYIAEASPFLRTPAIVVLDVPGKKSRRVLDRDRTVMPKNYVIRAPGKGVKLNCPAWHYPTISLGSPAMDDSLLIRDALERYYVAHDLPPDGGASSAYFIVRLGPLRMPLPNPAIRKQALLYHDIHHLATGYNTVFSQGEMIIAGYEIGAGCGRFAIAWIINLWMLALGLLITPRPMFAAFVRGRSAGAGGCKVLYHHPDERERFMAMTVSEMKQWLGLNQPAPLPTSADRAWFIWWGVVAWLITLGCAAIAVAAVWAIVAVAMPVIA